MAPSLLDDVTPRRERHAAQASAALRTCTDALPAGFEPLARLLLRAEGIASSRIEDVAADLADVAAAEIDRELASPGAGWIADNLDAVAMAITSTDRPLTVEAVHAWHATLMRAASHLSVNDVGAFRSQVGWVGGFNPHVAAHVATPPELVPGAMDDLLAFVNRDDIEPTVQAGLAHAQFELIHPYADGNGRLGRVLIAWILTRTLGLSVPLPVSLLLARDRLAYIGSLTGFRDIGVDHWLAFFIPVVRDVAAATSSFVDGLAALVGRWQALVEAASSRAAIRRAVSVLAAYPVVTAEVLAEEIGVTPRAARDILLRLHELEMIDSYQPSRHPRGRPTKLWVAPEVVDLITRWAP